MIQSRKKSKAFVASPTTNTNFLLALLKPFATLVLGSWLPGAMLVGFVQISLVSANGLPWKVEALENKVNKMVVGVLAY